MFTQQDYAQYMCFLCAASPQIAYVSLKFVVALMHAMIVGSGSLAGVDPLANTALYNASAMMLAQNTGTLLRNDDVFQQYILYRPAEHRDPALGFDHERAHADLSRAARLCELRSRLVAWTVFICRAIRYQLLRGHASVHCPMLMIALELLMNAEDDPAKSPLTRWLLYGGGGGSEEDDGGGGAKRSLVADDLLRRSQDETIAKWREIQTVLNLYFP